MENAALTELVTRAKRGENIDTEQLGDLVDELLAYRIQATAEARLRASHTALMGLVRSKALGRGDLDKALREITKVTAMVLAVGVASVWRFGEDSARLVCLERYQTDDTHESGAEIHRSDAPTYFEAVLEQRVVAVHDASSDPRTAELSRAYLDTRDIRALLVAPVVVDGRLFGVICGAHRGSPRNWSTYDEQFIGALADFSVLAIESHERFQTKERLREAADIAQQQLQTIEQQRMAIADLSAPIIDVWHGVLAVPLVGVLDSRRSIELTERLLERITASRASSVIVDLTGIDLIDTMTARHLLQMLRATRLLGAHCMLSGISPQIAQTLVQLGTDLRDITTVRSLQAALDMTLSRTSATHV